METNPLNKGVLTQNDEGIGPVTHKMVRDRAAALALIAGRQPPHASQADFQQAARELGGGSDVDQRDEAIEAMPESERWNPVPGSTGHEVQGCPVEDEDDEGRSETEQLVDEGAEEADRDTMIQAAKAAEKGERSDK